MTDNKQMFDIQTTKSWEEALENESWIAPIVDIYETEDDYFLTAQMPGVSKEHIKIKLEDGSLILMGRIDYPSIQNRKYILKEIESGNFFRRFKISNGIDESKIDAKFDNGILNVKLPKHERVKPKTIEIK
ncbi:MAG: Hsp20/alpha crystallin family protein [Ignavibacteria bacterium]|nr:Hsp20/alpha crystallin family protein [Ignavibacteria bacterium]